MASHKLPASTAAAGAASAKRESEPLKLVDFADDENATLSVTKEGAAFLEAMGDRPVAPISIAGPFRLGKSYLANRLLERETGFELGHQILGCTRGIWAWPERITLEHGGDLVVLDTEGLFDTRKHNSKQRDAKLLGFSILASSRFVFNLSKRVDAAVIDTLRFSSASFFWHFVFSSVRCLVPLRSCAVTLW
jgi:hypothetical protein